jgi:hypothetical protein
LLCSGIDEQQVVAIVVFSTLGFTFYVFRAVRGDGAFPDYVHGYLHSTYEVPVLFERLISLLRIDLVLCICFADYPLVFCNWYSAHQALQVQVLEENAICFACMHTSAVK